MRNILKILFKVIKISWVSNEGKGIVDIFFILRAEAFSKWISDIIIAFILGIKITPE